MSKPHTVDNEAPFVLVLLDEPAELEPELLDDVDDEPPARELGWLGLDDVLCSGCRLRLADGRLTPGEPLCVDCAGEAVEHWLAWLESPFHDWHPSDDPFGSARYPVGDWRAMEVES